MQRPTGNCLCHAGLLNRVAEQARNCEAWERGAKDERHTDNISMPHRLRNGRPGSGLVGRRWGVGRGVRTKAGFFVVAEAATCGALERKGKTPGRGGESAPRARRFVYS